MLESYVKCLSATYKMGPCMLAGDYATNPSYSWRLSSKPHECALFFEPFMIRQSYLNTTIWSGSRSHCPRFLDVLLYIHLLLPLWFEVIDCETTSGILFEAVKPTAKEMSICLNSTSSHCRIDNFVLLLLRSFSFFSFATIDWFDGCQWWHIFFDEFFCNVVRCE